MILEDILAVAIVGTVTAIAAIGSWFVTTDVTTTALVTGTAVSVFGIGVSYIPVTPAGKEGSA